MRICTRAQFLALPPGTVYQKYRPMVTEEDLHMKGSNCGTNDWVCAPMSGAGIVESNGSIQFTDRLETMESGASFPADFDSGGRDGFYDDEKTMFLVYERADLENFVTALQQAINGEVT